MVREVEGLSKGVYTGMLRIFRRAYDYAADALLVILQIYTLRFRMVTALPPMTAAAVSLSVSRTFDTAAELSLTLNHSVSPFSSGGKKG